MGYRRATLKPSSGYRPAQLRIVRTIHLAHAAAAEADVDLVRADRGADDGHSTRVKGSVNGVAIGPFWFRCCVSDSLSPSSLYE